MANSVVYYTHEKHQAHRSRPGSLLPCLPASARFRHSLMAFNPQTRTNTDTHSENPVEAVEFTPGEHGFFMDFPNGYRLSVQYGIGNYCGNQSYAPGPDPAHGELGTTCTVEVAVLAYTVEGVPFVGLRHDVAGSVSVDNLGFLIQAVEQGNFRSVCVACDEDYIIDLDPTLTDEEKQTYNEAYAAIEE